MSSLRHKLLDLVTMVHGHLGLSYIPTEIDAEAAAILNSAARAVKHTLDHRAYLDSIGLRDQPMVVIVGETHPNVAHQVHQTLILDQLIKQEDVAIAFEQDHNALVSRLPDVDYADYKKLLQHFDSEQHGALSLKNTVTGGMIAEAPLGRFAFSRMVLKNKIKVCFCDVATTLDEQIDREDPSSLDSIRFFTGNELPPTIPVIGPMAIAIRNHHMMKLVMDFAATNKPRIIFLQCGALHVISAEGQNFENGDGKKFAGPDYALSSFFNRAAFPSVGIIQPPVIMPENKAILACRDLPQIMARYNPNTGKPNKQKSLFHIRSAAAEASYLNALLSRTGLASEMVSLSDWKAGRDQCEKDVSEYLDRALKSSMPKIA